MAYIGKTPVLGNFVKLDAISVVNGQAAYTMQNGGVNFTSYDNVNQFLVSLNGILQSPTDSFTVSGSTLTFASNLSTGDVIDFVMVLGNTLDIGTPSDNTVSLAKLTATGTKDATTFLRGDNTFAEAGGGKVLQVVTATNSTASDTTSTSFTSSGLEASITPSSTSNKILVITSNSVEAAGTSGLSSYFSIYRDSTNLGDSSVGFGVIYSGISIVNPTILDSPSTTSSVTYKFMGRTQSASTTTYFQRYNALGTITLLEIAGWK